MDDEIVFKVLLWLQFARALASFASSRGIRFYGRHISPAFRQMATLPARLGWFLMEAPALVVPPLVFLYGRHRNEVCPQVMLFIFTAHYFHRTLVYPLRISGSSTPMPLLTALLAAIFNGLNAYIQARWISHFGSYSTSWLRSWQFLLGTAVFGSGMAVNVWADGVLISLRKASSSSKYQVPWGGLYELVSCPNYLGETLEWFGWSVLSWSAAGFVFFVYTIATLAPRALAHHRWYQSNFPAYPPHRKALIPFLI